MVLTEAVVGVDGEEGWASVLGFDEHAAVAAAILDAWAEGSGIGRAEVHALCARVQRRQHDQCTAEAQLVAATEVT